ncbi:phage tail protein [Marinagarivorans algicola]|uniref:phage tail protein n=1 Tax=Marinagarivorans algicola TaxID=1513270 RepID=UPI0006B5A33F|nr:phage tail protein [Marinagarivorans algicola]
MPSTLLKLGSFKFSTNTAAFDRMAKKHSWRWAAQARFGNNDLLQYTGKDAATISLSGIVATHRAGVGIGRIDELVAVGNLAVPQLLVAGTGEVMGYWVVTNAEEVGTRFVAGGAARRQAFTLELTFYGANLHNA